MAEIDGSKAEFQHYVPKLHLNQWRTKNEKGQNKIWVYGKSHPPVFLATRNVGGGENYYRTRAADGTDDNRRIERFLGVLEDHAGKIYKKIRKRHSLSVTDRKWFARYLRAMYARGPYWKAKSRWLVTRNFQGAMEPLVTKAENIADPRIRKAKLEEIELVREQMLDDPDPIFAASIESDTIATELISNMEWTFYVSEANEFITSDSPFVYETSQGIANEETGYFLHPIDRQTLLHATQKKSTRDGKYLCVDTAFVSSVNLRIIGNAFEQVFASYESAHLDDLVKKNCGANLT